MPGYLVVTCEVDNQNQNWKISRKGDNKWHRTQNYQQESTFFKLIHQIICKIFKNDDKMGKRNYGIKKMKFKDKSSWKLRSTMSGKLTCHQKNKKLRQEGFIKQTSEVPKNELESNYQILLRFFLNKNEKLHKPFSSLPLNNPQNLYP